MKTNQLSKIRAKHIIGIACTGHGASIAYIGPGNVVRCSVLDRWAGVKHVLMFAKDELRDIMAAKTEIDAGIKGILSYSFGRFPASAVFEDMFADWLSWLLKDLAVSAQDIDLVVTSDSHFATCEPRLGLRLNQWFPSAQIVGTVEHHVIHQCQGFWQSGFEEAAVLTLDTCGEDLERHKGDKISGTIVVMNRKGKAEVVKEFLFPESSAGLIYAITNHHIGFRQGEEGKTMGLAPYGKSELFDELRKHLELRDDGSFKFLDYKDYEAALHKYVEIRQHSKSAELLDKHKNVAYAGQALIELIVENTFKAAMKLTGLKNIAYSGGVALNSVANDIAFRKTKPENLYVAPNPGDTGQALGCALYGAYNLIENPPTMGEIPEYLGPEYSQSEIEKAAKSTDFNVAHPENPEKIMAACIANGYITARFAGGAEFGPRALGNRSILCDPRREDMKDYLNARVKHREHFRPFAPSVLYEQTSEWFELSGRSSYMLRVAPARIEVKDKVPAIVHVDGTARVQTLEYDENPGYYRIIEEFYKLTGTPMLLDTSFNIAGKPIVETPADAVECFKATEIDLLLLDTWILSKKPLEHYLENSR